MRALRRTVEVLWIALSSGVSVGGCGGGVDAPSAVASGGSGGSSGSAGGAGTGGAPPLVVEPAPPVLTPCPARWTEKALPSGVIACEPGALPDWTCVEGWTKKRLLDGTPLAYDVCEAGPLPDWPCPPGWPAEPVLAGTARAYSACRPPEPPSSCPAGSMPVLGASGCVPIGAPCPAGDQPVDLPSGASIVHVAAGASGGDGSASLPYGSIAEAIAASSPGTTVAMGKGLYEESLVIDRVVTLWGACAGGVEIRGGPSGTIAVAAKGDLTLRNATISGAGTGLMVSSNGTLTVRGVWVHEATSLGITTTGGRMDLEDVLVSDTRTSADLTDGYGLAVLGGVKAKARRVTIERTRTFALAVQGAGTVLEGSDLLVRDTMERESDGLRGRGVYVSDAASATLSRIAVRGSRESGIYVAEPGTKALLSDVSITDTAGVKADQTGGWGLVCQDGAELGVERAWVSNNRYEGIAVSSAGTKASLVDVVVVGTRSEESGGLGGVGLGVQQGASATISRSVFDRNRDVAVTTTGDGTLLDLADVMIQGTLGRESDDKSGIGLLAGAGAAVTARGLVVEDNRLAGIFADGAGTMVTLTDAVIAHTQIAGPEHDGGWGVEGTNGASLELVRTLVDENVESGVIAFGAGTTLALTDVAVSGTHANEKSDLGLGLTCANGAVTTATRVLFDRNHQSAALVYKPGATLTLSDSLILHTLAPSDDTHAYGLTVNQGGRADVSATLFEDNGGRGVFVSATGSKLHLSSSVLRDTAPPDRPGISYFGLYQSDGASADVERSLLDGCTGIGAFLSGAGVSTSLHDVVIQGTRASPGSGELGRALSALDGPTVSLVRAVLDGNTELGVAGSGEGTAVELTDVLIQGTKPSASDGVLGAGVGMSQKARLTMTDVVVRDNRVAGVLLQGSSAALTRCLLSRTLPGAFTPLDENGIQTARIEGVGDGLVALLGSSVQASNLRVSDTTRAGLLFSSSGGTLENVTSTGNEYGLVLMDGSAPDYSRSCSFEDNEKAILKDGALSVPNAPLPLPARP
jgi:hypothetical protein